MASSDGRLRFAELVNQTRLEQHLSIRTVARIAGVPHATAQGWLSGKHFPTPALRPQHLRLVDSLGLTGRLPDDLWDDAWATVQPALRRGGSPYLGLRPFGVEDEAYYFGRAADTRRLAQAVGRLRAERGHGLVFLVGPSGSGKSSLLAAGLVARECADGLLAGWRARLVDASGLGEVADEALDLVLVDQVEDALVGPDGQWQQFLAAVHALAEGRVVVIALRSDAFARAIEEPSLREALSRPVLLGQLTHDELREVITGPAGVAGVRVDDDLVRVMLSELVPGPGHGAIAADVLPLLSNALLVTWAAGSGKRMTLADYDAAGGISTAVESLAEQVFVSLDGEQQAAAEGLFLRLVRVASDVVGREPLPLSGLTGPTREVMDAFVAARMLTVSGDTVRISHDALLGSWQRLADWVSTRRDDLVLLEKIRRATAVWEDTGRDPDALLPVQRLAVMSEWLDDPLRRSLLSAAEAQFLDASRAHFTSVLDAERRTSARLRRQRRTAIALTAATTVLALTAGLASWRAVGFQRDAEAAQDVAELARSHAEASRLEAQSRQIATMAGTLRDRDPNLLAQLAVVSADLAGTQEARSILLGATAIDTPTRWLGEGSAVVATSPDGSLVARAGGTGQVTLWRSGELVSSRGTTFTADPDGQALFGVALGRVGSRELLAVGGIGSASLWDVTAEPRLVADLGQEGVTVYTAAFSPDGSRVVFGTHLGRIRLVSLADPDAPGVTGELGLDAPDGGEVPAVSSAAFDSRGVLYVAGTPGEIRRWRLADEPVPLPSIRHYAGANSTRVLSLAVTPDGTRLAAGLAGLSVMRWELDGEQATRQSALEGFTSFVNDVSFSADGRQLIAGSSDQSTRVYDAATGEELRLLPGPAIVTGADFAGDRPVTTGADGALRVWSSVSPVLKHDPTQIYNLATDADGRWLAGGTTEEGTALWDLDGRPRRLPTPQVSLTGPGQRSAAAVSPDGEFLIGASRDGQMITWPLTAAGAGEASVFPTGLGYFAAANISPDGRLVAAMEYTGNYTVLLGADRRGTLTKLATLETPVPQFMWFSADSSLLVVALASNSVAVYSVADPARPEQVATIDLPDLPSNMIMASTKPLLAIGHTTGRIDLWDLTAPASPLRVREFGDPRSSVYSLAFSPDDSLLIATSGDDRVWGWDLASDAPEARFSLDLGLGRPWDARFVQAGSVMAVSGSSGAVKLVQADAAAAAAWVCEYRGDPLTPQEWERYLPGVEPRDPC